MKRQIKEVNLALAKRENERMKARKEKGQRTVFSSGGPQVLGNAKKKEKEGGVLCGGSGRAHYASPRGRLAGRGGSDASS